MIEKTSKFHIAFKTQRGFGREGYVKTFTNIATFLISVSKQMTLHRLYPPPPVHVTPSIICVFQQIFQIAVIHAFGIIKRCAAQVNIEYGLNSGIANLIQQAANEVLYWKPAFFTLDRSKTQNMDDKT